jgi:hypothetical protein
MAAPLGIYIDLSTAELSALRTQLETARTAILTGNQSVSRAGISYTRADLRAILEELREVIYAQSAQAGTAISTTYADLQ